MNTSFSNLDSPMEQNPSPLQAPDGRLDEAVTSEESQPTNASSKRADTDPAFDYLVDAASDEQEGLFPSGEVSLIAGPSGAGKTTWLLQFILSLKRGERFFGRETNPKPYVFLCYDRSIDGLKRTCRRMRISLKDLNPLRPTDEEAKLSLVQLLEEAVKKPKFKDTKVFFIEGLDMLVPQGKTGDLTTVSKFLDSLQRLASRHALTIIGSVGSPKTKPNEKYQSPRDRIFGSVGWGRKVETIIYLEQDTNQPDSLRQLWILPRNGKEEKHVFRWERGRLIETDTQGRVTAEQRVVRWMEANIRPGEEFQLKQVASALNCSDSTAQSALDKLVKEERVEKPRRGHYRRPVPMYFAPVAAS
jgi:hypothetical protein